MLKDCIEIFARELEKTEEQFGNREKFILDSYIPADGDYIVVQKDGTLKSRSFKLDKKTRTLNGMISGSRLDDDIKFYSEDEEKVKSFCENWNTEVMSNKN